MVNQWLIHGSTLADQLEPIEAQLSLREHGCDARQLIKDVLHAEAPRSSREAPNSSSEAPSSSSDAPSSSREDQRSSRDAPSSSSEAPRSSREDQRSLREAPRTLSDQKPQFKRGPDEFN